MKLLFFLTFTFLLIFFVICFYTVKYGSDDFNKHVDNQFAQREFYDICLLTRVKNVAYLLPQWFEFHIAFGVDHFFVVDDCSNDGGDVS